MSLFSADRKICSYVFMSLKQHKKNMSFCLYVKKLNMCLYVRKTAYRNYVLVS